MMTQMNFEKTALLHAEKYPLMQAQDFLKLAYQSAFGAGHMVSGFENALERIQSERTTDVESVYAEDIGNGYARLYLTKGQYPLSSQTIARMFVLSAQAVTENKDLFFALTDILKSLSHAGKIRSDEHEITNELEKIVHSGFSPVSHTQAYRDLYAPAYRVVKAEYASLLPLISKLDEIRRAKSGAIACIDGMCASGKTTLANLLGDVFDAPVYHMDDFFLPPAKRTKERLDEIGGNVDYERFRAEVLNPLLSKKVFSFRPFDCSQMDFGAPVFCKSARFSIVEGSYSCHPELMGEYDFKIYLDIDSTLQLERIRARNGERMLERFKNEWIPMENRYFEAFDIPGKADYIIHTDR